MKIQDIREEIRKTINLLESIGIDYEQFNTEADDYLTKAIDNLKGMEEEITK